MTRPKLIRLTAHSQTLGLLRGQLKYLAQEFEVIIVAKDTGNLRSLAEGEGVEYRNIDMRREIAPLADLKSLFSLMRLFRKERPDIVHANTPKGALLGLLAARIIGVKNRIYNVNGLRFETATGFLRRLLIAMERITCLCATRVIPQSNGVANVVRRQGITHKPMEVILNGSGNGVDTSWFDPSLPDLKNAARSLRSDDHYIEIVFVGRMVGDKGVNELVNAFDTLSCELPNVRLHIVGGREENLDPVKSSTLSIIANNNRIIEHGHQTDVRPFLAAADIFVLPSYREGFPNVVLEAAAMNLPCIVTDVNGAQDIIIDGFNGLIIPKRDTQALLNAFRRLCGDSELRREMASRARSFVKDRFERHEVCRATLEMYRSLFQ